MNESHISKEEQIAVTNGAIIKTKYPFLYNILISVFCSSIELDLKIKFYSFYCIKNLSRAIFSVKSRYYFFLI